MSFPVTATIEYEDARGNPTRRLVDIWDILESNGVTYLETYCHKREGERTFRADRITCFITSDGEIIDPEAFLSGLPVHREKSLSARLTMDGVAFGGDPVKTRPARQYPKLNAIFWGWTALCAILGYLNYAQSGDAALGAVTAAVLWFPAGAIRGAYWAARTIFGLR